MQPIEGVENVFREIAGAGEAVGVLELHVVGVKGVGQHDMAPLAGLDQPG